MSINLLEAVQQNLGYPSLQKIDPNTQEVTADEKKPNENKFSQAAIPAVLTGLYKYVQSDEGAADLLGSGTSSTWINKIFDDSRKEVIQTISAYTKQPDDDAIAKMNDIASEAVKLVKENLPDGAGIKEVKIYFKDQRNTILLYLPATLNLGELLNDGTLDDNTNKMEGPVSSLMQSIGAAFSEPVTEEEIKTQ